MMCSPSYAASLPVAFGNGGSGFWCQARRAKRGLTPKTTPAKLEQPTTKRRCTLENINYSVIDVAVAITKVRGKNVLPCNKKSGRRIGEILLLLF